jgi:hypothetical protein
MSSADDGKGEVLIGFCCFSSLRPWQERSGYLGTFSVGWTDDNAQSAQKKMKG